jgi:hypothetical protein
MDHLHHLNATWTQALRRVSPQLLIRWLESTGEELASLMEGLDPFAPALFAVAWAGENRSANWFDIAREYTEKWHHTQQIFEATGKPSSITTRSLFHPCLDTFMRALPFTYRNVQAEPGSVVAVTIQGEAGGTWLLERGANAWGQVAQAPRPPRATVSLGQESAWKLVTRRRDRATTLARFPDITIAGEMELGLPFLDMVSMMA